MFLIKNIIFSSLNWLFLKIIILTHLRTNYNYSQILVDLFESNNISFNINCLLISKKNLMFIFSW
jgi:hypothetical protein